jgi:hypothetical protein
MPKIALLSVGAALAALAALVVAQTAPAKEISSIQLCGPQACKTVTDRETIGQFERSAGSDSVATGPATPGGYYVLRVTVNAGESNMTWQQYYIPSARKVRELTADASSLWHRPSSAERAFLDSLAAGLQPYPVPEVTSATVGRKVAANAASYLNLYRLKATPNATSKHSSWKRIRLHSASPSPWTDGMQPDPLHSASPSPWTDGVSILRYQPKDRLLDRDGQYVRLTKRLGRALQRAAALQLG